MKSKSCSVIRLILLSLVILPLFVAFCLMGWAAITSGLENQWLLNQGSRTVGTVIEKVDDSSWEHPTVIKYTFSPRTRGVYTNSYLFIWSSPKVGDQIEIAFDPENPSRSLPANSGFYVWYYPLLALLITAGILSLGGWFLVWAGSRFAAAWRIRRRK